ncbi:MAG: M2 family metallopeptidase, partial [Chloroflexota bacterium]|nr:M2 family metallopeptidase [Chloroflexota bacterium]
MEPAAAFLSQEEAWARRALSHASLTWWNASITGRPRDYQRMASAERAVNRHYARPEPYQRLLRLVDTPELDALTRRRLHRLRAAYRAKQAPVDVLDRITSAESDIQERYSTFRAQFDGHSATDNEIEDVLRTARETPRVREAWEARKQIGAVVADDLRRLAHLRNEAARAIGFADYWQAQLELDELDPEKLLETLDAVDVSTRAPFQAMKADLDGHLATRFDVKPRELRPWHYADPFFQETPEVFAPPADPLYVEHDVVAFAAETYRALGFQNIDAILGRSDLYPRAGKNQHAYAVDIDRQGDVRTFLNVERNARWMGTLLHELGHTIYQDGIDRAGLPW